VSGPLTIVASHDIGNLGPREGTPVVTHWSVILHVMPFLPWLVLAPFLFLHPNRNRQAWAVLIPVAVILGGLFLLGGVLSTLAPDGIGVLFPVPFGLVLGLAIIWLFSYRMQNRNRAGTLFFAAMLLAGAGVLTALAAGTGAFMFVHLIIHGAATVIFMLAFTGAASWCRRRFTTSRFIGALALCLILATAVVSLPFILLAIFSVLLSLGEPAVILSAIGGMLVGSLVVGIVLLAMLVPFLVLSTVNQLYRQRFLRVFRLPGMNTGDSENGGVPPPALPTTDHERSR